MTRTVQHIIESLPQCEIQTLDRPNYKPSGSPTRLALVVSTMANHMSNEGWQLMEGLGSSGYSLAGYPQENQDLIDFHMTDVKQILRTTDPGVVLVQDKREWDRSHNRIATPLERFTNVEELHERDDVFKMTVVKDAHQRPQYHSQSAAEMGVHAWVTYYHPAIIKRLAPYLRLEHCIRTTHTIDKNKIPVYHPNREGTLMSGAVHFLYYPMRVKIVEVLNHLPSVKLLGHPDYHNRGTNTNEYLKIFSKYKVAICTSSKLGYSLRKIIEATACGCRVITDLPCDDVMPMIDDNLHRIDLKHERTFAQRLKELIHHLEETYEDHVQYEFADVAKAWYDFRIVGYRLANNIERLRRNYP